MEPFVGQIQAFGFNFPPIGWAFCQGQLLAISQNEALFSLLGTTFGGDGRTTFGLPDLRSRSIVHVGNGPGLDVITWGEKSGAITKTLIAQNLPAHNHTGTIKLGQSVGNTGTGTDNNLAFNAVGDTIFTSSAPTSNTMAQDNLSIQNTGGSQSFNIRNPFLGINYCIALFGIYPSRS